MLHAAESENTLRGCALLWTQDQTVASYSIFFTTRNRLGGFVDGVLSKVYSRNFKLNDSPIKLERAIQLTGTPGAARQRHALSLLAPLGFECAQHWRTPRPSVERIHRKALLPFGSQKGSHGSSTTVQMGLAC